MMMVDAAQVNIPSYRRKSAEPGFSPADRRLPTTRECQQSDTSEPLKDWGPGHRDRPLSFRWKANYETLSRSLGLPACKSKRGERAMASIVYDSALAAREDAERRISYSRRKAFYTMAGRYDGTDYGYDTVVPAVDALVAVGLLVDHDKVKGGPGGTGIQSSFRPMPGLAEILLPRPSYRVGETIRLKDAKGHLIGYRDTERTRRDRRIVEAVNRHIAEADIGLGHINGVVQDEAAGTIFFPGFFQWLDDGYGDHTVYTAMKELYRIYNGAWTLGGRFYGGWWQQVRGGDRQHLLIDGETTVEIDYEMLHPRLLYAQADQRLAGDAYTLDGWARPVCKRAFNILLNAGSYQQALGAILPHVGNSKRAATRLIADMKKRHGAVADYFHSGAGLRLQNFDAEMAKSVLRDLTVRQDITVLPIHDSFVVRKEHQAALEEAMDEALAKITASIGDRRTVSNGCSGIYPHRGDAGGDAGGPRVGGEPRPDGGDTATPPLPGVVVPAERAPSNIPSGSSDAEPSIDTRKSLSDPVATGVASSDRLMPRANYAPNSPDTVCGVPIPIVVASNAGGSEAVTKLKREARQSTIVKPTPQAEEVTTPKALSPPAFLNPANWNKVAMAGLHRAADRPLKGGRTVDGIPNGKQRRETSRSRKA